MRVQSFTGRFNGMVKGDLMFVRVLKTLKIDMHFLCKILACWVLAPFLSFFFLIIDMEFTSLLIGCVYSNTTTTGCVLDMIASSCQMGFEEDVVIGREIVA
jgi:hypothetical protein